MNVTIYTDGACSGNPGPGGWCAILVAENKSGQKVEKTLSGGDKGTTNNRMELTSVIEGLSALKVPCDVTIVSDSKYVCDAFNQKWIHGWASNGWRKSNNKPVLNDDLWKMLFAEVAKHDVSFSWIKGHAGHPENERCDAIASKIAQGYSTGG